MSKLIDADELKQKMEKHIVKFPSDIYTDGKNWGIEDCIEDLEKMPSVEAIPIEWLQKKLDKWKDRDLLGLSLYVKLLIEDWEKENARD